MHSHACLLDERLASIDGQAWPELRNPFAEVRVGKETV